MKTKSLYTLAAALALSVNWSAAQSVPVAPEDAGLSPKTSTLFINLPSILNNDSTESLGVAVGQNGNVMVGWEDDGDGLTDAEAVWTLLDSTGAFLTPDTIQTAAAVAAESITNRFVSFFRPDGSAIAGRTSWGPKIKANLFGSGFGMGATAFELGNEVPALAGVQNTDDDFPAVQLVSETGAPIGIVAGADANYASRTGGIRVGDWDYLSNGNVLIVGESRQDQDLVDIYGGDLPKHHAVYRIVTPAGAEVKAVSLASETPIEAQIWHGAGVAGNGFAIRFGAPDGTTVRLFANDGAPISTNINLATATGFAIAGAGGRGDGIGFHGNGKDAYVSVSSGTDPDGLPQVWATVINTNGTIRYSKGAITDVTLTNPDRVDAAIYPDGRVLVVFDDAGFTGARIVLGRFLKADGTPDGPTFYVSEIESPDAGPLNEARRPRAAWRNNVVAVTWESLNSPEVNPDTGAPTATVALRIFGTFQPGSAEAAGLTRIVPDVPVILPAANSLGNWEPYASVLGTTDFLIEGNTFAQDSTDNQRFVVAIQPAVGGATKLVEGFYADNGTPYSGQITLVRENGNPGRVAGDKRPGAQNYVVGAETSVHTLPEFQLDNRWNLGFDRLENGRFATVEAYRLNTSTLTPTPLSKALDSANGRLTSGTAAGAENSRFGGELAVLDNGNYVSLVEDRTGVRDPAHVIVATIFAPDGTVVKDTWTVAVGDIWSNLAAYKGGFCIRAVHMLYFYNNAGDLQGTPVDQSTSGASYDAGRGDGTRIFGHINSPYVYLTGKVTTGPLVRVSVWDSRDRSYVTSADVSEGGFSGDFDRANGAVDALDRFVIGWVSKPSGYTQTQVAARVLALNGATKTITPLTPSFFPFINHAQNDIRTLQMSLALTTKQILVAAKGEINTDNKPENGPNTPTEVNFYTVLSHPAPAEDPTTPASTGGTNPTITVTRSGNNLTISWPASFTGFTLQSTPSLTPPITWTTVPGVANNSVTISSTTGTAFFRVMK
jgi:hypothetical protein